MCLLQLDKCEFCDPGFKKKEALLLSGGRGCLRSYHLSHIISCFCFALKIVSSAFFNCGFRIFLKHFHSDKCPVFKLCCREVIEHKKQEREEMMRRKIQTHNKNVKQLVGGFVTADILMSLVTLLRTFPSVHVSRIK